MADGDNTTMPEREDLATLLTAAQVSEGKSETEAVALQRLKNENTRFVIVAVGSFVIVAFVAYFLSRIFPSASAEAQGRIIYGAGALLSAAMGVFVGRVSR